MVDGSSCRFARVTPNSQKRASPRQIQQRQIIDAVRRLFDRHGLHDPSIEAISQEVGINKATIYRHVASKDELLLLVQCSYQDELTELYADIDAVSDPLQRLDLFARRYIDFCQRYPAYLDCATSLMRRSYADLSESVSPAVLLKLTNGIAKVNGQFARTLAEGDRAGVLDLKGRDPDHVTALAYSLALGGMHLARFGMSAREGNGGFPDVILLDSDAILEMLTAVLHAALGVNDQRTT